MNKFITFIFILASFKCYTQLGVSSGLFRGKDAGQLKISKSLQFQYFHPIFKPIYMNKAQSKGFLLLLQPALKIEWLGFTNPLIFEQKNGLLTITSDPQPEHQYKNTIFSRGSSMKTTSLYLPVNALFGIPKISRDLLIGPGLYAEYLIGGNFKRKYYINNELMLVKNKFNHTKNFYALNRFTYGPCIFIIYKNITIYGIHSLAPVFKQNDISRIYKYNFGILFNIFGYTKPF